MKLKQLFELLLTSHYLLISLSTSSYWKLRKNTGAFFKSLGGKILDFQTDVNYLEY